eukprot:12062360-Alexandrium_andersonii.AAC.1
MSASARPPSPAPCPGRSLGQMDGGQLRTALGPPPAQGLRHLPQPASSSPCGRRRGPPGTPPPASARRRRPGSATSRDPDSGLPPHRSRRTAGHQARVRTQ